MVVLQSRLERSSAISTRTARVGLLLLIDTGVCVAVGHQSVGLLGVLLASPDTPADNSDGAENDGTTDTDNNADDGAASLGRHARGTVVALVAQAGC